MIFLISAQPLILIQRLSFQDYRFLYNGGIPLFIEFVMYLVKRFLRHEARKKGIQEETFLNDLMEKYPSFKGRINSARVYFTYVVVPSRTNDRVDDIEFISKNEVKAYTEDAKGQTVVLYHLENQDGKWKIAK